ncbi:MAG: hypothetical protein OEV78_11470 [Spirochaetia bacterium]|nr:hypothetical protein [Spirochaetia bacterium]
MNNYDFGKYYRGSHKQTAIAKSGDPIVHKMYRKISIGIVFGLILFFTGLMTGINFQSKKIISSDLKSNEKFSENSDVINSANINPDHIEKSSNQPSLIPNNDNDVDKNQEESENAKLVLKKTLLNPENEYIILAKKYNDGSKDRALYYAGVLNKITKDYNFEVVPSIRGKNIKLYVGPMKGKKTAEKMLARVKSIPEFTNSAILYKK